MSTITAESMTYEESTAKFTIAFKDQAGVAMVPLTLAWSLMTHAETIINNRLLVAKTAAAVVIITLEGDDLQILNEENRFENRVLVINATDADGSPLVGNVYFKVQNQVGA